MAKQDKYKICSMFYPWAENKKRELQFMMLENTSNTRILGYSQMTHAYPFGAELMSFNEQPRNSLCVSVGMKAANMGSELLGSL